MQVVSDRLSGKRVFCIFGIFTGMNYSQDAWLDGHCTADWGRCSRLLSVKQDDLMGQAMCNGSMGTAQQTVVCAADWCLCSILT